MIQKTPYFLGLDLNIDLATRTVTAVPAAESIDASRSARFFAVDAPSSSDDVPSLRGALCRGAQGQKLLLSRSVLLHGLRATDVPRESAGYRVESSGTVREALSSGDSRGCFSQHARQCQCDPRLAHLRELRRAIDRHRTRLVCRGTLRRGPGRDGLRARCHDHRSVFVGLSVGAVSIGQSGRQTAHAAGSARQYSQLYSYLRRQDARRQRAGLVVAGARCLLRNGSRLPGLPAAVSRARGWQFLRHARQVEPQSRASLLASGGSSDRADLRSDGNLEWLLFAQRVSRSAPSHQVHRSEDPQAPRILDQSGLPALSIADLYRCGWQVELFFKWIKQHLRIKAFFGTSENAVKTQIWIAISVYVLVAIVKKRLNLPRSLYENLQILSLTLCEQMPLDALLAQIDTDQNPSEVHNQMNLFD